MLVGVTVILLLLKCLLPQIAAESGGWQTFSSSGLSNFGSNHLTLGTQTQDLSVFGSLGGGGWNEQISLGHGWQNQQVQAIPISEHIQISKPAAIPVIKNIGIPVAQPIGIPVPHITAIGVPQPYPVHVPQIVHVPVPVVKTIATIVEKKVPVPVEKIVPVPVEKLVPHVIEKHIPTLVEKPYPIHVPYSKYVFHKHKTWSHWDR